jgi:hypothetical protein
MRPSFGDTFFIKLDSVVESVHHRASFAVSTQTARIRYIAIDLDYGTILDELLLDLKPELAGGLRTEGDELAHVSPSPTSLFTS